MFAFLFWSSQFAQGRAALDGGTTRADRRRRLDSDRNPRTAQQRAEERGRAELPHRRAPQPGQGALRQGRHGLPVGPAVADVRRLRRPLRAEPAAETRADARADSSRNARQAGPPAGSSPRGRRDSAAASPELGLRAVPSVDRERVKRTIPSARPRSRGVDRSSGGAWPSSIGDPDREILGGPLGHGRPPEQLQCREALAAEGVPQQPRQL